MGRLIYADKLQGEFDEIITHLESTGVKEFISKEEFLKCLKLLKGCIDEQPTAYDVDKVEKEIKSLSGYEIYKKTFELIIKIVRKGGVNDWNFKTSV